MHSLNSSNPSNRLTSRRQRSPTQADFVARARRNVPIFIRSPHPFAWWRTLPAQRFRADHILVARRLLMKSAIIGEPHWFLGVAGDAAVTVGVALRIQRAAGSRSVLLDLAMTALVCVAVEGNLTAALLLSSTLRRLSKTDARCGVISESWLAYAVRKRQAPRPSG